MKAVALWLTLSAFAMSVGAQDGGLAGKLSEAGAEWLIGEWTGTDPEGRPFTLTYAQLFDGQAGSVHFKSEGMEMKGLIAVDPSSDDVRQFSVTSTGELVSGTWYDEGGDLILDVSWTTTNGSYNQRSYVYNRVDAKTVKVVMYNGPRWQSDTTRHETELKRGS